LRLSSMRNAQNVIKHELIGLNVEVCTPTVCLVGKVVDETKNMLVVQAGSEVKKFPKKGNEFVFLLPGGKGVKVKGEKIFGRPEDRIKMKVKKW